MIRALRAALALAFLACAQTEPDGAGLARGTLPDRWNTGGPDCATLPKWQVHEYNEGLTILRESGCTHYEKPFLYLFFGRERALLIDTGAGAVDTADIVSKLLDAHTPKRLPLVVAHSHGHGDHTAGDKGFASREGTLVIPPAVADIQKHFGIADWPSGAGSIDLGGRKIEVIPIPGHDPVSIAFYDPATGILHMGDSLYPGRLYVADFPQFAASIERLVRFTAAKPVSHILGNHIEQTATPYLDYPVRTKYQPGEHSLALARAHLLELHIALQEMSAHPVKKALRDFTIWPR